MSDEPIDFVGVVRELALLRRAVTELGIAQAEAFNALGEWTKTGGPPYGPTRNDTAHQVLAAARNSLDAIKPFIAVDDR